MGSKTTRHPSRPSTSAVGALAGGTVGVLAGAFTIDWIDPGAPDMTMEMLIAMGVGGGVGWVVGAAFGWIGGRGRPAPAWFLPWVLIVGAGVFAWFGLGAVNQAHHALGPMIDDVGLHDPLRDRLALTIAIDTILAITTLLLLATAAFIETTHRRVAGTVTGHVENS